MSRLLEMFGISEGPPGNQSRGLTRDPDVPAAYGGNVTQPKGPRPPEQKVTPRVLKPERPGLSISGDTETLEALMTALQSVRSKDQDIMDWVDSCTSALRIPVRQGQLHAQLPKFEETPDLDDFDDDDGGSDEEDH